MLSACRSKLATSHIIKEQISGTGAGIMSGCRVIGIVIIIGSTAIMCVRANGIAGTRTDVTIGSIMITMIITMVIIIDSRQRSLRSGKLSACAN